MEYGHTSEMDWTVMPVRREVDRIPSTVAECIQTRLARSPFDPHDWLLIYAPIIMGLAMAPSYPTRSRCQHKKRIFSCGPQLDQPSFVAGPGDARWRIYVEGLHDAETLMRRPKLPREVIDVFRAQVDTLADAPEP